MNREFKGRTLGVALLSLCLSFAGFTSARAFILTANFDDLTAGSQGTSFSDGGISFLNLYAGDTNLDTFAVQTTTNVISGFGTGTNVPNNYLTFGGYQPGNAVTFGALSSLTINFPGTASAASLYIAFQGDTSTTNTLTFEALNGTNIVTSQTLAFNTNGFALTSDPFSLSGSFTSLKFLVSGLDNSGTLPFGLDNLVITTNAVPEPSSTGLVGLTLAGALLLYFRFGKRTEKAVASENSQG